MIGIEKNIVYITITYFLYGIEYSNRKKYRQCQMAFRLIIALRQDVRFGKI